MGSCRFRTSMEHTSTPEHTTIARCGSGSRVASKLQASSSSQSSGVPGRGCGTSADTGGWAHEAAALADRLVLEKQGTSNDDNCRFEAKHGRCPRLLTHAHVQLAICMYKNGNKRTGHRERKVGGGPTPDPHPHPPPLSTTSGTASISYSTYWVVQKYATVVFLQSQPRIYASVTTSRFS